MRHTPLTPLATIFAPPIAAIGLFFLAACSAPPAPLPTQPTSTQTIPATVSVVISPLPSPTPAADEPASPITEVVSGGRAPDFALAGAQGVSVTLSDYRDENPSNVVLVFYQGKT